MKDDVLYLKDIRDQCADVIEETSNITYEEFSNRRIYQNGIILSIIIIGEAAKQLSEEFKETHPGIPISLLAKTRDKLVHGYRGIDIRTVWQIAVTDVPKLYKSVTDILKDKS